MLPDDGCRFGQHHDVEDLRLDPVKPRPKANGRWRRAEDDQGVAGVKPVQPVTLLKDSVARHPGFDDGHQSSTMTLENDRPSDRARANQTVPARRRVVISEIARIAA